MKKLLAEYADRVICISRLWLFDLVDNAQWVPVLINDRRTSFRHRGIDKRSAQGSLVITVITLFTLVNFLLATNPGNAQWGFSSHLKMPVIAKPRKPQGIIPKPIKSVRPRTAVAKNDQSAPSAVMKVSVNSVDEWIGQLQQAKLWDLSVDSEIPSLLLNSFPGKLDQLDVETKKRVFLHSLLPIAKTALAEVAEERARLIEVLEKFRNYTGELVFAESQPGWQEYLTAEELQFITSLTWKYRTQQPAELLARVDSLPLSLIMAMGAFESAWGTSRFAREGNNLFGMWTWERKGIIPARREPGKTHKLAVYDSILDAVRHYILTINRLDAYEAFRQIRQRTMDSSALADGLLLYSERGEKYVADIKRIIRRNNLKRFDPLLEKDNEKRRQHLKRAAALKKLLLLASTRS